MEKVVLHGFSESRSVDSPRPVARNTGKQLQACQRTHEPRCYASRPPRTQSGPYIENARNCSSLSIGLKLSTRSASVRITHAHLLGDRGKCDFVDLIPAAIQELSITLSDLTQPSTGAPTGRHSRPISRVDLDPR
jgi:hypothetical protein